MSQKRVYIAGHNGMVGSALVRNLESRNDVELILKTRQEL
ncbi:NAD-dependent epimerase/dehydratase family protein, partial [Klebsiella pneumoniae]